MALLGRMITGRSEKNDFHARPLGLKEREVITIFAENGLTSSPAEKK
jgi:hypothetical protein